MHGEKSVVGPDRDRVIRNEAVASVARAVLEDVIEAVFARPDTRLVVYGTLAPGQANHSVVADLRGEWTEVRLVGELREWHDYPAFVWSHPGTEIAAWVLASEALTTAWSRIDRFEGNGYARHLLPVMMSDSASFDVVKGYVLADSRRAE
jgi:gamma-glutamylcyclotransferase (GGCT)/AIG2-like uncharacterized protein YtfP